MLKYSGKTSSYHHKWNNTPNPDGVDKGLRKVWFLDAQWSDCPVEVEDEVKALWVRYNLGNDRYMFKTTRKELIEEISQSIKVDYIVQYLAEQGVSDECEVVIHWWW